ncbi:hypothetical protein BS78_02G175400 [Paspalum vaginatum]|nr:hypothetical protein BS78_02G175400 [Paspalum vaginatum]
MRGRAPPPAASGSPRWEMPSLLASGSPHWGRCRARSGRRRAACRCPVTRAGRQPLEAALAAAPPPPAQWALLSSGDARPALATDARSAYTAAAGAAPLRDPLALRQRAAGLLASSDAQLTSDVCARPSPPARRPPARGPAPLAPGPPPLAPCYRRADTSCASARGCHCPSPLARRCRPRGRRRPALPARLPAVSCFFTPNHGEERR